MGGRDKQKCLKVHVSRKQATVCGFVCEVNEKLMDILFLKLCV